MNTYENIKLIGLVGLAGSGKDTVADLLKDQGWEKFAFANALKDMCIDYLGLSKDDVYTQEGKMKFNEFWGMTNREILQKVGTDCFRNMFHKDTWVKIAELKIKKLLQQDKRIIISDCRFDNEAELIEKFGGIVMQIQRNYADDNLTDSEKTHISEQGINKKYIARIIKNNSTLDDLKREAHEQYRSFEVCQEYIVNQIKNNENIDKEIGQNFIFMTKKFWKCRVNSLFSRDDNKNIRVEWVHNFEYNYVLITNDLNNKIDFNIYNKMGLLIKEKSFSYDWDDYEGWIKVSDFINKN